ncbi:OmpA family protein [Desulfovibrio aminophilus]|uniref:OmpA family protein n=1 Tax=Desulfovibrio aminophilus TaxID=81425 RepID=UPI0003FA821F|nr:OmpA family protein [Desulfovibrio aminophilus]
MIRRAARLLVLLSLCCAPAALAGKYDQDVPGSKDIPGLPRYEGSVILGYKLDQYDEAALPLGKWVNASAGWEKSEKVEGRRTRILYLAPPDRSSLEVMRNYKTALQKLGYQTRFECSDEAECGRSVGNAYFNSAARNRLGGKQVVEYAFSLAVEDPRLLTARLDKDGAISDVFVFAARQDNAADSAAGRRVAVFVQEVLSGSMENKMVLVDAGEMGKSLDERGRVALYGVLFDFDRSEVKPESRPQLEEMAKLLKAKPGLKVYIVGHTDNQGGLDYNLKLSHRRAEAVAAALAKDFGVASGRMSAKGLANLAPVASNASEEGRAKNRRVELVEQ